MEELLRDLSTFLYNSPPGQQRVTLQAISQRFAHVEEESLETGVILLERAALVSFSPDRTSLRLNVPGKTAFQQGTVAAICLGNEYIAERVRRAVVAIEVAKPNGDLGMGSGFFTGDFPGFVVTAGHVVAGNHRILRVLDADMREIADDGFVIRRPQNELLDLALLSCQMPEHCEPISIEWDHENIDDAANVLIAGFPYIAGHERVISYSDAFISSIAQKRDTGLQSLVIGRVTSPGFSGGPVVDRRGIAVGVVEQENETQDAENRSIFISAIPTPYLRQL